MDRNERIRYLQIEFLKDLQKIYVVRKSGLRKKKRKSDEEHIVT
jgi:hypothetical protein